MSEQMILEALIAAYVGKYKMGSFSCGCGECHKEDSVCVGIRRDGDSIANSSSWSLLMQQKNSQRDYDFTLMPPLDEWSFILKNAEEAVAPTCWTCNNRLKEECAYDGKEVYEDTPACKEYSPEE